MQGQGSKRKSEEILFLKCNDSYPTNSKGCLTMCSAMQSFSHHELEEQKCDEHVGQTNNTNTIRMTCSHGGSCVLGAINFNFPCLYVKVMQSGRPFVMIRQFCLLLYFFPQDRKKEIRKSCFLSFLKSISS